MKKTMFLSAGLLACTLAAQAQEGPKPLWEIGAFVGAASTPAYPGASNRSARALALPYLIYRGETLRAERGSVGARLVNTEDLEFDIGFAASLPANSTDTTVRQNMRNLGTLIEFGPRLKMTLARPSPSSRVRLEVPVRAVLEFNQGVNAQGAALEPELVFETRDIGAGWGLSASGSLVLGNQKLNNYFYGVSATDATPIRPAYAAQGGLIATRLALSTSKDLTPDIRVFGFVRYESYAGAANTSSPLHLASTGSSVGIGLAWTLGRSEQRAKN